MQKTQLLLREVGFLLRARARHTFLATQQPDYSGLWLSDPALRRVWLCHRVTFTRELLIVTTSVTDLYDYWGVLDAVNSLEEPKWHYFGDFRWVEMGLACGAMDDYEAKNEMERLLYYDKPEEVIITIQAWHKLARERGWGTKKLKDFWKKGIERDTKQKNDIFVEAALKVDFINEMLKAEGRNEWRFVPEVAGLVNRLRQRLPKDESEFMVVRQMKEVAEAVGYRVGRSLDGHLWPAKMTAALRAKRNVGEGRLREALADWTKIDTGIRQRSILCELLQLAARQNNLDLVRDEKSIYKVEAWDGIWQMAGEDLANEGIYIMEETEIWNRIVRGGSDHYLSRLIMVGNKFTFASRFRATVKQRLSKRIGDYNKGKLAAMDAGNLLEAMLVMRQEAELWGIG